MAAPAYRSIDTDYGTGTSFTMSEPSGAASGDGLLAFFVIEDNHSALSPPSGWTAVPSCNNIDVGTFHAYAYYIQRGGSAPALGVSWTTSKYYEWTIVAYSGVSGASFVDASAASTPSTGTGPDCPAITTTVADTRIVTVAYHWSGFNPATPPPGHTLRLSGFVDIPVADATQATAGSVDPGTWDDAEGSDRQMALTIALAPTGGGGGGGAFGPRRSLMGVGRRSLTRDEWQRRDDSRIYTRRAA